MIQNVASGGPLRIVAGNTGKVTHSLRSAVYIVPGIIGVLLSLTLVLITSMAIVRERERGTLEQLIVTPIDKTSLMLGKILPFLLIGYVQITVILVLGRLLFRRADPGQPAAALPAELRVHRRESGARACSCRRWCGARCRPCSSASSSCCRTSCSPASCSRARPCRRRRSGSARRCRSPTSCRSCAACCSRASGWTQLWPRRRSSSSRFAIGLVALSVRAVPEDDRVDSPSPLYFCPMIHLARQAVPLGATWDGEGTNFALSSEHATAVELCLFDAPDDAGRRSAIAARGAHRRRLARLPARRRPRAALRLSRARPLRAGAGASLQPRQAAARSLRPGAERADPLERRAAPGHARRPTPSSASGLPGPARQRRRHAQVRRGRAGVRLGRRPAAAHAVGPNRHLRVPRQGHDHAAPRGARGAARHLPRPRHRADHRAPPAPRRDRRRAAAGPPLRHRAAPGRPRPGQLLGLQPDRLLRAGRRATPPAGSAGRSPSSRPW